MLDPDEADRVAEAFGVALPQVEKDHLVSELLGGLSAAAADDLVFIGGTARQGRIFQMAGSRRTSISSPVAPGLRLSNALRMCWRVPQCAVMAG